MPGLDVSQCHRILAGQITSSCTVAVLGAVATKLEGPCVGPLVSDLLQIRLDCRLIGAADCCLHFLGLNDRTVLKPTTGQTVNGWPAIGEAPFLD